MSKESLGYLIITGLFVLLLLGFTIGWMFSERWIKKADEEDSKKVN